ncbi:hypothetical protein CDAR_308231 [Caerostris darwini]|uniref:Uncharacterized protein n=1 Tax=Caerostris darwini TaxID=1538125 RepID=A0AAV4SB81_9ARAC|nr:hypothetical protein CDAR_308231 [Caerostris darwini]
MSESYRTTSGFGWHRPEWVPGFAGSLGTSSSNLPNSGDENRFQGRNIQTTPVPPLPKSKIVTSARVFVQSSKGRQNGSIKFN